MRATGNAKFKSLAKNVLSLSLGVLSAAVPSTTWALGLESEAPPTLADPVHSANKVGLEFMRQTIRDDLVASGHQNNTLVSPISVYSAFAMLRAGITGVSQQELDKVLNVSPGFAPNFDSQNAQLLTALRMPREASSNEPANQPKKPVLGIDNLALATNGKTTGKAFEFAPQFVNALQANYLADAQSLDFTKPEAAEFVNKWVEKKTEGLIDKVIDQTVMEKLVWVLMNTTYLEANWAQKFKVLTGVASPQFKLLTGQKTPVTMIATKGELNYMENAHFQAAEIPMHGADLAFTVVVPKSLAGYRRLTEKHDIFNVEKVKAIEESFAKFRKAEEGREAEINVELPKFTFAYAKSIIENSSMAKALGVNFLFSDKALTDFAPLGGFVGEAAGSKVGIIKQDAKIALDEYGVKAAAVTTIGGVGRSSSPVPTIRKYVVADRPFVFFIKEKKTDAILFVGTVVDPTRQ
jgi:serine protease inhibitor